MVVAQGESHAFLCDEADPPSKQALLQAALTLFVRQGYDGTSIREIANHAGYTNPALFKFFAGKEELALHLFQRVHAEVVAVLETALSAGGGLEDVMGAWADVYVHLLCERTDALVFLHENLGRFWPALAPRLRQASMFDLMQQWFTTARRSGLISTAVPMELQFASVTGLFRQLSTLLHVGALSPRAVGSMRPHMQQMLVTMLAPGPAPSGVRR